MVGHSWLQFQLIIGTCGPNFGTNLPIGTIQPKTSECASCRYLSLSLSAHFRRQFLPSGPTDLCRPWWLINLRSLKLVAPETKDDTWVGGVERCESRKPSRPRETEARIRILTPINIADSLENQSHSVSPYVQHCLLPAVAAHRVQCLYALSLHTNPCNSDFAPVIPQVHCTLASLSKHNKGLSIHSKDLILPTSPARNSSEPSALPAPHLRYSPSAAFYAPPSAAE